MKKIAVFTSGGDSPGMNACIRAVVRAAIYNQVEVLGIRRGYAGMILGDFIPLDREGVQGIINRGGTILGSARSAEFMTPEGRQKAFEQLKSAGVEGVVVIGGDGSFKGATVFMEEHPEIPFVGIPGTIDNDLYGTDYTLGYDTAINTALEAIDKIRDTAEAYNRLFFVEVMGRDAGFIALRSGIAGGAEAILVPEVETDIPLLIQQIGEYHEKHKHSCIIVVAEGDDAGGAFELAKQVRDKVPYEESRVTVLGHIQRGGTPTCADRVLAAQMGIGAVEALLANKRGIMIGVQHKQVVEVPFEQSTKHNIEISPSLKKVAHILSAI